MVLRVRLSFIVARNQSLMMLQGHCKVYMHNVRVYERVQCLGISLNYFLCINLLFMSKP